MCVCEAPTKWCAELENTGSSRGYRSSRWCECAMYMTVRNRSAHDGSCASNIKHAAHSRGVEMHSLCCEVLCMHLLVLYTVTMHIIAICRLLLFVHVHHCKEN